MKEALLNGVDLSAYGAQIEKELNQYSNISIRDYIRESKNIAHLHMYVCLFCIILGKLGIVLQF